MAAILKNGCHFFPAEYRQGSPPRSCAGRSPEHIDTQHVFTAAHVRWTPKTGFCSLGINAKCNAMRRDPTSAWNYMNNSNIRDSNIYSSQVYSGSFLPMESQCTKIDLLFTNSSPVKEACSKKGSKNSIKPN